MWHENDLWGCLSLENTSWTWAWNLRTIWLLQIDVGCMLICMKCPVKDRQFHIESLLLSSPPLIFFRKLPQRMIPEMDRNGLCKIISVDQSGENLQPTNQTGQATNQPTNPTNLELFEGFRSSLLIAAISLWYWWKCVDSRSTCNKSALIQEILMKYIVKYDFGIWKEINIKLNNFYEVLVENHCAESCSAMFLRPGKRKIQKSCLWSDWIPWLSETWHTALSENPWRCTPFHSMFFTCSPYRYNLLSITGTWGWDRASASWVLTPRYDMVSYVWWSMQRLIDTSRLFTEG